MSIVKQNLCFLPARFLLRYGVVCCFVVHGIDALATNPGLKKSVDLHFVNFCNSIGYARIGIYNNPKTFCNESIKPFREVSGKIVGNECFIEIFDLPDGEYALTLLHDENDDLVMNYNFLGLPKEGYAFSNNAFPVLSKPSFNSCKIKVVAGAIVTQTIKVRYLLK